MSCCSLTLIIAGSSNKMPKPDRPSSRPSAVEAQLCLRCIQNSFWGQSIVWGSQPLVRDSDIVTGEIVLSSDSNVCGLPRTGARM